MKILFIGGTGNISSTLSRLIVEQGHELHLVNRGKSSKYPLPKGGKVISHDVHGGGGGGGSRGEGCEVGV
jgi:predicted dinucleotide-binding enzyme